MNRHELGMRNRALAEKRLHERGPRGPFPFLTRTSHKATSRSQPERLLVLCPGDPAYALFSTPALYALRVAYPQAHITAGVGLASEAVLRHNREIDDLRVIPTLDAPEDEASPRDLGNWPDVLDAEGYHTALVMAPTHWVAGLLAARARIPRRVGLGDENGAGGFLTDRIARSPDTHAVTHNLLLVEALVGALPTFEQKLRFWMTDAVAALAYRSTLADLIDDPRPLVAIHPGNGSQPTDWRPEGWAFVADQLMLQHDANVVFFGDKQGTTQREAIARGMRFEPTLLDGPLDPLFMAALFERCKLVMGGHSGLLHLAVALEKPVLFLYGPHDPVEVGPWGDPARYRALKATMPCAPCHLSNWSGDSLDNHPCVRDLDSYTVLDNALELLAVPPLPQASVTGLGSGSASATLR
jgi:heptosyltransferase-2/heptosyltransferase-3